MAVSAKHLVDLPDDILAIINNRSLEEHELTSSCELVNTIITKTLCLNYMANSQGPVGEALEIRLKYPDRN
ncbi:hypothetical protein BPOR_0745g00040 [Botrytis porri]|uniref:Uncharacterized protein n=1 Tax=Botrytis porri TaxID=87229 RepID=A0A4Z1K9T9_9HELO|nr:hypothetical protein BPOR_0745g00040 [Botrytis porri]